MRKIKNVHQHEDPKLYNCFGCSPHNQKGLQLEFWEDGDEVFAIWEPQTHLMGWVNVVHGGIQATLMDEISGWVVYVKCATAGVTANMNVKFRKPLEMDRGPIKVIGKLREKSHRLATIDARIEIDGVVYAEGVLKFFLFPEKVAREQYYYPGVDAFFEE